MKWIVITIISISILFIMIFAIVLVKVYKEIGNVIAQTQKFRGNGLTITKARMRTLSSEVVSRILKNNKGCCSEKKD